MTTRPELLVRITPIFREVFDQPNLVISETLSANEVDEWDSLNHISLIVAIEEEFKGEFSTDELAGMKNIGDLLNVILARKWA